MRRRYVPTRARAEVLAVGLTLPDFAEQIGYSAAHTEHVLNRRPEDGSAEFWSRVSEALGMPVEALR